MRLTLDKREDIFEEERPDMLLNLDHLAVALVTRRKYKAAVPLYRRAHAEQKITLGTYHPDTLPTQNNLTSAPHKGLFRYCPNFPKRRGPRLQDFQSMYLPYWPTIALYQTVSAAADE